jgi:hypothetical protein
MKSNKTKVKFLVNEREGEPVDLFAYFPAEYWANFSHLTKTCYSHIGQHSACSTEYANESREATPEEYADLKAELESIGYDLQIMNSKRPAIN